jgi:DNA-binding XRE family transcriptional regulator
MIKGCKNLAMIQTLIYDEVTADWFKKHPLAESTVCQCPDCKLWYKGSLGHKCKYADDKEITIGQHIRKNREARGYSRKQVAIKSNVSVEALRAWESNKASPSIDLLIRVADVLNIGLDDLVGRVHKT